MIKLFLLIILIVIFFWRYKYKNLAKVRKKIETVLYAYVLAILISSIVRIILK